MLFVVLVEDLEVIVFGHADGGVHGGIDQLPGTFGEGRILTFFDIDANQWHGQTPDGCGFALKYMMKKLYRIAECRFTFANVGAQAAFHLIRNTVAQLSLCLC
ncbi:hypothetical protein D3C73_1018610 [compost metagenome]